MELINSKKLKELITDDRTFVVVPNGEDLIQHILDRTDYTNFYVVDINKFIGRVEEWKEHLPEVTPYYAVKSNPDPILIYVLNCLNVNFDCASGGEIELVNSIANNTDIVYANPCKEHSHIKYALEKNVKMMTFDCASELDKIKQISNDVELILRLKVDDSGSECKFSSKFGCDDNDVEQLIKRCRELDLNLIGFSFHVGSRCKEKNMFLEAIKQCRNALNIAEDFQYSPRLLDIGGGFPNNPDVSFERLAQEINSSIDSYFHDKQMKVIAEPGRFFSGSSHTLICTIIGVKLIVDEETDKPMYNYYINDSVYQSFGCNVFGGETPMFTPLVDDTNEIYKSTVFGQTCDGIDVIFNKVYLPKLNIGDKCRVDRFGAYTRSASTSFNGFQSGHVFYAIHN